jgi:hypothetical protein
MVGVTTAEGEADSVHERRGPRRFSTDDVSAVLSLLVLTVHLAGHDGGRPVGTLTWAVLTAAVLLLPTLRDLRPLSTSALLVTVGVAAGPAIAWTVAPYRAGGARPMLVGVAMALGFLAARRIWSRSWGPTALGLMMGTALTRAWYGAFLAWWGSGMGGGRPQWLALSWHNQSGTLMAVGTILGVAATVVGRGRLHIIGAVWAGVFAAGMWLSGSRGAVLAGGLGVMVVLLGARHIGPARLARAVFMVGVAAVLSTVLLGALVASGHQPLAAREESAEQNLTARIGHAEAAVRMALAHPAVGTGPGSYRWASLEFYPDDVNLTASAHNEYL